jgi:precorrin-2/cobalt-factor-2 C20-methyltransferase
VSVVQRLVGVGVGPGDPELVTVKAVRVLREADVVLVPVLATDEPGRAEATVRAHLDDAGDPRVRRVVFALDDRGGVTPRREAAWDAAADAVVAAFRANAETVAFATIGDPAVYSTFAYLAQTVRERVTHVEVRTVPGITAMQDLAARAGVSLCEGEESLALFPMTAGLARYRDLLRDGDTVVAYKGGRHLPEMLALLDAEGRLDGAVVGSGLGLPGERVVAARDCLTGGQDGERAPYLTTVIAPPRRASRGGRL